MAARTRQRLRLNLSSPEDGEGEWTVVGKGRGRRKAAPPDPPPRYRQYRLLSHQEPSVFLAIRGLERSHPEACFRVTGSSRSGYFLRPQDETTAFLLARVAREPEQFGMSLDEVSAGSRGVVLRYPVGFSLDPILADPRVTFAKRCTYSAGHGRREPTRQVVVAFRDGLPGALDLGSWGVYSVRKYTPEPVRCFKCQAFGHVQKHCQARELCAVCSGRHPTAECISALRDGERRAPHCPNCGKGHHAWSKLCPERLRRLPPSRKDGAAGPKENVDARPLPAAPREGSHEVSQRPCAKASPTPTTPATSAPLASPPRRRRKRSKAKAASTVPATVSTADFGTSKPATAEAAVQTDPPPQPETHDVEVQAVPETRVRRVQATPKTASIACQADDWEQLPAPNDWDAHLPPRPPATRRRPHR